MNLQNGVQSLSVIIPTFGRDEDLINAVESVLRQEYSNFELIIVDQSVTQGPCLASFLRRNTDKRFHYFQVTPPSLPAARNFGVSKATGEIIVFIDDDVKLLSGFLEAHARAYDDASVSGVAGRVVHSGEAVCSTVTHIGVDGMDDGSFNSLKDQNCSTMQGCNMSFRRSALRAVGSFDTRYYENAHREESDICSRLIKRGHRLVFRSAAALFHYQAYSGGCREICIDHWRSPAYYHNDTLFFLKNRTKLLFCLFLFRLIQRHVLYGKFLLSWTSPAYFSALVVGVIAGIGSYLFGGQFQSREAVREDQVRRPRVPAHRASR